MRKYLSLVSCVLLIACGNQQDSTAEIALAPDAGQSLALVCSSCHGVGNTRLVDLSSYSAGQLRESLIGYRDDQEGNTVMHRIARGYEDADIDRLIAYLAATGERE